MIRLLSSLAAGLLACWAAGAADPTPPAQARSAQNAQDLVYFAEGRPVLLRLYVTIDGRPLAAVWDEYVGRIFKYLDNNGDGYLDKEEVQRVPPPGALFGGTFGGRSPTLSQLDTNRDGKVTREELRAYFQRLGALPFQVPSGATNATYAYFVQDLVVEPDQVFRVVGGRGHGAQPSDPVNAALFKLLDTNGDGKLSREELAAAASVLLKRDRNDDEMITPDEIEPGAGRGAGTGTRFAIVALNQVGASPQGNGPFWLRYPGASRADLARRLLQHYAKSKKPGQTAPTKLSRQDLGLDDAAFAQLDVDGDGFLDAEELTRFSDRTPDLTLQITLGKEASVELVKSGAPLESSLRKGKGGELVLEMNGTRIDLKALAAENVETAQAARQERDRYLQEFKKADRDKNGYLDMAEAMRSPLYRNVFKLMDRDGDGMLFEKEVLAYLDAYQQLQALARTSCATVGIASEGKGLFELLDTNGDGRLSVRELRNAPKLIAELDRDGDGMISRLEIPRCTQAQFRLGPASPPSNLMNYSGDLVIAFSADGQFVNSRKANQPKPPGPEWFRKMDRNGDGDVSRREFIGTDAQFREIDTDGDGLISLQEAEAYEKKMRERREKK